MRGGGAIQGPTPDTEPVAPKARIVITEGAAKAAEILNAV